MEPRVRRVPSHPMDRVAAVQLRDDDMCDVAESQSSVVSDVQLTILGETLFPLLQKNLIVPFKSSFHIPHT